MKSIRLCDAVSPGATRGVLDPSSLLGTWINTNRETRGVARLVVGAKDGAVTLRVLGTHPDGLVDWGPSDQVITYASSANGARATALTASYELKSVRVELEGNFNRGVLVLACYTRYKDGSGRAVFFREYYALRDEPAQVPLPFEAIPLDRARPSAAKLEDLDTASPARMDPAVMAGYYVNTKAVEPDLLDVTIHGDGQGSCGVKLRGHTPEGTVEWGEVAGLPHACFDEDLRRALALRAVYRFDAMDVAAQIRNFKGLTVIATFAAWKDGSGRSNYFTREFFHRA